MRGSYGSFAVGLFTIFCLTLFFNNFVETEKKEMDRMQREWTREEHHLMDELRQTMAEIKRMMNENTDAMRSKSVAAGGANEMPSVEELRRLGLDDEVINLVKGAIQEKKNEERRRSRSMPAIIGGHANRSGERATSSSSGSISRTGAIAGGAAGGGILKRIRRGTGGQQPQQQQQQQQQRPPPAAANPGPSEGARTGGEAGQDGGGGGLRDEAKLSEIREEFLHAWKAYEQYAWGRDVVKPVSRRGEDEQYRMGITLLDSLDTMYIMGLKDKFDAAVEWVRTSCHFGSQEVSVFETTIRALGGLLAAYHLSGEKILLQKAEELGKKMEPAFDTPTGFPKSTVRLSDGKAWCPSWSSNSASFSEVTTLYLEWNYLAKLTGNDRFRTRVERTVDSMIKMPKIQGLYAQWVSVDSGRFTSGDITLGSRVDSAYEYLEKIWRASRGTRKDVLDEYLARVDSVEEHLIRKSRPNGLTYIQQCTFGKTSCHGQFDHLVCFAPAMLALGAQDPQNPKAEHHMRLAEEITETCWESYKRMPTGLAPEIIKFDRGEDFYVDSRDTHNLLRPETVESLFVMWRLTHEQKYRDWAWQIFQSFKKWTRVEGGGYSSIQSVKVSDLGSRRWRDHTESFFFAETMKYLYLTFTEDSVMDINKYVFNTEAHAFPI